MGVSFGKIGELYKLQKEARVMQKEMKKVFVEGESGDGTVVVRMNGLQEIDDMDIDPELLSPEQKDHLVKRIQQAVKSAQKKLRKEMSRDMDVEKLRGMLGG